MCSSHHAAKPESVVSSVDEDNTSEELAGHATNNMTMTNV